MVLRRAEPHQRQNPEIRKHQNPLFTNQEFTRERFKRLDGVIA